MKKLCKDCLTKVIYYFTFLYVFHLSGEVIFSQFTAVSRMDMYSEGKLFVKDGTLYSDAIVVKFRDRVIDVPAGTRRVNIDKVRGAYPEIRIF